MAFYVDSLPPEENRNHAMGYYVGTLALGYSTGNFFGGLIADHLGYRITFQLAAYLSLLPCFLLWLFNAVEEHVARAGGEKKRATLASRETWKALLEPGSPSSSSRRFFSTSSIRWAESLFHSTGLPWA
jgi:predicted MFS family arabinose efflux permease